MNFLWKRPPKVYPVNAVIAFPNLTVKNITFGVNYTHPFQDSLGTAWVRATKDYILNRLTEDQRKDLRSPQTQINITPTFPCHPNTAFAIRGDLWTKLARTSKEEEE
jgi:hypothetical protein